MKSPQYIARRRPKGPVVQFGGLADRAFRAYMREIECEYWRAMFATGLSVSAIARRAGVHRTCVYSRIYKLGLADELIQHVGHRYAPQNEGNALWNRLEDEG